MVPCPGSVPKRLERGTHACDTWQWSGLEPQLFNMRRSVLPCVPKPPHARSYKSLRPERSLQFSPEGCLPCTTSFRSAVGPCSTSRGHQCLAGCPVLPAPSPTAAGAAPPPLPWALRVLGFWARLLQLYPLCVPPLPWNQPLVRGAPAPLIWEPDRGLTVLIGKPEMLQDCKLAEHRPEATVENSHLSSGGGPAPSSLPAALWAAYKTS